MRRSCNFPVVLLGTIVLVSCSTDSPPRINTPANDRPPIISDDTGGEDNAEAVFNPYFGFLDGDGSSSTFIDIPAENSSSNLLIGRWQITKIGIDENNDGNVKEYGYEDFKHKDCGTGFLQFNADGVVFENSYYENEGTCTFFAETDNWEELGENRFKVYSYDNIYLVSLTQQELVLKYDWNFENSLYGPVQVYYHYVRI